MPYTFQLWEWLVRIFLESKGHKPTSRCYLTQPSMVTKGQKAKRKPAGTSPSKRNTKGRKNSETDCLDKPILEPTWQ